MVAVDAMHTQVDTAEWITQRGGRCLLTVQGNQKTLHRKSEGSAVEERPVHILGRRLSWAAGTTHPQGPRGSQVGGSPHTRTNTPDPLEIKQQPTDFADPLLVASGP